MKLYAGYFKVLPLSHTRFKYYLKRTDPDFVAKALEIIKLYEQHRLSPDDFDLVCIDELSGLQALQRKHPVLPMKPGLIERREFEYTRHGTRCLMAAFDVGNGHVYGKVTPDRKGPTFIVFLEEVLRWRPDKVLHLVMDMIEIWFSILKAKCIKRGNFIDGDDLAVKIINYIYLWDYYFAHPFNWKFTEEKFWEWYEKKCRLLKIAA